MVVDNEPAMSIGIHDMKPVLIEPDSHAAASQSWIGLNVKPLKDDIAMTIDNPRALEMPENTPLDRAERGTAQHVGLDACFYQGLQGVDLQRAAEPAAAQYKCKQILSICR